MSTTGSVLIESLSRLSQLLQGHAFWDGDTIHLQGVPAEAATAVRSKLRPSIARWNVSSTLPANRKIRAGRSIPLSAQNVQVHVNLKANILSTYDLHAFDAGQVPGSSCLAPNKKTNYQGIPKAERPPQQRSDFALGSWRRQPLKVDGAPWPGTSDSLLEFESCWRLSSDKIHKPHSPDLNQSLRRQAGQQVAASGRLEESWKWARDMESPS